MTREDKCPGMPAMERRTALTCAVLCWIGYALVAWAVQTGRTAGFDRAGLLLWRGADMLPAGPPFLTGMARALTGLGDTVPRNLLAVAATAALLLLHRVREAIWLIATVITGSAVNAVAKHMFDRMRPNLVPRMTHADGLSFPSGHSFNGAAVYIAMALAFACLIDSRTAQRTWLAGAMFLSMAIAWSRVWLGVHWPSDAIAGWLGGAGWALATFGLLYRPAKTPALRRDWSDR
jgi:undecaprenyl-diphosphatase